MTAPAPTTSTPFQLSFMTANYVARELGYGATTEWGLFDAATNAAFEPLESFATRFDDLLATIASVGFDEIDLWFGHLNWRWATSDHVTLAREAVRRRDIRIVSLAGSIGETTADVAAACQLANDLDVDLIAGVGPALERDRDGTTAVLAAHGVRFGLENHPERTPSEVLAAIGESDVLGAAVDTGWWATQGYDPAAAIDELAHRLFHVHLKDVEAPGTHVTCMHGDGCADIARCIEKLLAIGYTGPVSIEHHPFDRDPTDECARALALVRERLAPTRAASRA